MGNALVYFSYEIVIVVQGLILQVTFIGTGLQHPAPPEAVLGLVGVPHPLEYGEATFKI